MAGQSLPLYPVSFFALQIFQTRKEDRHELRVESIHADGYLFYFAVLLRLVKSKEETFLLSKLILKVKTQHLLLEDSRPFDYLV